MSQAVCVMHIDALDGFPGCTRDCRTPYRHSASLPLSYTLLEFFFETAMFDFEILTLAPDGLLRCNGACRYKLIKQVHAELLRHFIGYFAYATYIYTIHTDQTG